MFEVVEAPLADPVVFVVGGVALAEYIGGINCDELGRAELAVIVVPTEAQLCPLLQRGALALEVLRLVG